MNMERAKNIIILFLVLINLALLSLNYIESRKYALTNQQKEAIFSVLEKNQISLYTHHLSDFKPLRQLQLTPYYFDEEDIMNTFFEIDSNVTKTETFNEWIYSDSTKSLYKNKNNNQVIFENPLGTGNINLNDKDVIELCESYLLGLPFKNVDFTLDHTSISANGEQWVLEYRSTYKGHIIYSNLVRFTVTENGIIRVRCSVSLPVGFIGEPREIYSADEALFQLMYRLKSDYSSSEGDQSIKILKMDMVYHVEERITDSVVTATPYYRFYIRPESSGQIKDEPYLINAYNNTFFE